MNERELKKLLSTGETDETEFKESPNKHFYETISAMSNRSGGIILLGVDDKGNITGVESSGKFLEDLTNRIVNKLSIYPEIKTIDTKGKRIITIKINRSNYPVSYEGRYYERVGNTTREMSPARLHALLLTKISWDSITNNFPFNEIDTDTVKRFVRLAIDSKRLIDISLKEPPEVVLKKLELMVDGKLTNGAILLFGKNPQKYFINLCVRIGRFKTETIILDDKWARGNLFNQFEEALNILIQHMNVRYEIKHIRRKEIWDYPIPALREALLNALVHRNYFEVANFTLIKFYDDHIWFTNPGKLVDGITIDELKKPHNSFSRNPLITKIFYLCGYIEHYGSGTVRMVEWMKKAGLPEPEYKEELGGLSVYFHKDIYAEENLRKMGLNERQIKAVIYTKEKGKITNKEYHEINNISRQMATIDLSTLVEKGFFNRLGKAGKGIAYQLTKLTNN